MSTLPGPEDDGDSYMEGGLSASLARATHSVIFLYSPASKGLLWYSSTTLEVLGINEEQVANDGDLFLRFVHPDDRFSVQEKLERSFATGQPYFATYRWLRPDSGELRVVTCRASLVTDDFTHEPIFLGSLSDISDVVASPAAEGGLQALQPLLQALPNATLVLNHEFLIVGLGSAIPLEYLTFGLADPAPKATHVGFSVNTFFDDRRAADDFLEWCDKALYQQEGTLTRSWVVKNRAFQAYAAPIISSNFPRYLVISVVDVTATRRLANLQCTLSGLQASKQLERGLFRYILSNLQLISTHANLLEPMAAEEPLGQVLANQIQDLALEAGRLVNTVLEEQRAGPSFGVPCDLNHELFEILKGIDLPKLLGNRLTLALGRVPFSSLPADGLKELLRATLTALKETLAHDPKSYTVSLRTQPYHHSQRAGDISSTFGCIALAIQPYDPAMNPLLKHLETLWKESDGTLLSSIADDGSLMIQALVPSLGRAASVVHQSRGRFPQPCVVVLSEDQLFLDSMASHIVGCNARPVPVKGTTEAGEALVRVHPSPDLVIIDDSWGTDTIRTHWKRLKGIKPTIQGIVFHSFPQSATDVLARSGIAVVLQKPVEAWRIKAALEHLLSLAELRNSAAGEESALPAANER